MKGGHEGYVSYCWGWAELSDDQQKVVSKKFAEITGMYNSSAYHALSKCCTMVMVSDGELQIVIAAPLAGFTHPEMECPDTSKSRQAST